MSKTLLTAILFASVAAAQSTPLTGVWKVAEFSDAGPRALKVIDPPGIYIFTAGYYSLMRLDSNQPRKVTPVETANADELRAMFGTVLNAHSGKFEISGDKLTLRPAIAKNPLVTAEGHTYTLTFRIEGNTALLTDVRADGKPGLQTLKLVRLE